MERSKEEYMNVMTEVISKQSDILGPAIAILKAKNVSGLNIDGSGVVTGLEGDPKKLLQLLVDEYVALSGEIVRTALSSVFDKYPEFSKNI